MNDVATGTFTALEQGGWAPYLDRDELLLWEGQPASGLRFRPQDLFLTAFGLLFGGFAVFWMSAAIWMGAGDTMGFVFVLFGLPFVAIGAYMAFGRYFVDSFRRARTRYALTDKRGIIATNAFGRSLVSHPIGRETEVEYLPGRESTIWFARTLRQGGKGRTWEEKKGFEYIPDGDHVYRLIRQIKEQAR